jgi:hypothetical protein
MLKPYKPIQTPNKLINLKRNSADSLIKTTPRSTPRCIIKKWFNNSIKY